MSPAHTHTAGQRWTREYATRLARQLDCLDKIKGHADPSSLYLTRQHKRDNNPSASVFPGFYIDDLWAFTSNQSTYGISSSPSVSVLCCL